jgi:predicted Zn finger-like uncharacterized protein
MTRLVETRCPRCQRQLEVNDEQLRSALGQVRCGQCLQVFDAGTGDIEFIAPKVSGDEPEPDFAGITVAAMATADPPAPAPVVPIYLKLLGLILLLGLVGQISWHTLRPAATGLTGAIAIKQLIVRQHPELDNALQLDSVLLNDSSDYLPYPDLLLRFATRYGEATAQRRFVAGEYLPYVPDAAGLAPRTRVQVSLSLVNPGPRAVNYALTIVPAGSGEN